jgi:broad specificity phosphatase PhoE
MSDDQATSQGPLPLPRDLEASLVISRHGESTWITEGRFQGAADPPLSVLGEQQAELLAARLKDARRPQALPIPSGPPVAIWHSPLTRTTATAAAIGAALAVPLTPEPDLREIAQGDWEGRLVGEILTSDGERLRTWRHSPVGHEAPGGERLVDVDVRARRALNRVVAALTEASRAMGAGDPDRAPVIGYGGPPATRPWGLIVGHDGLLRVAMLALLGLPLERFWTFPFVPAGITVIEFHSGSSIVRAHDLDDHLAPLQAPLAQAPASPADAREGAL